MNPRLYREVQLIRALPASELGLGDRAIAIDYLEHPEGGEMGAVLELSQSLEREQYVVTVPVGSIAALTVVVHLAEGSCSCQGGRNVSELSVFQRILNIFAGFAASMGLGARD